MSQHFTTTDEAERAPPPCRTHAASQARRGCGLAVDWLVFAPNLTAPYPLSAARISTESDVRGAMLARSNTLTSARRLTRTSERVLASMKPAASGLSDLAYFTTCLAAERGHAPGNMSSWRRGLQCRRPSLGVDACLHLSAANPNLAWTRNHDSKRSSFPPEEARPRLTLRIEQCPMPAEPSDTAPTIFYCARAPGSLNHRRSGDQFPHSLRSVARHLMGR